MVETPGRVLTLDIGTSSVRASFWDARDRFAVCTARRAHRMATAPDGMAVIPVEELTANVEAVMDDVLASVGGDSPAIAAVGMATLAGNVLAVDDRGRNLTPLITYADTRSEEQVTRLREDLDEKACHQRTGTPFHSAYLPARLVWFREEHPELWKSTRQWRDIGTHLYARWFHSTRVPTSYSMASWNGLLHRTRLAWDGELLDYLGVPEGKLPGLADFDRPCTGLAGAFAKRWPALRHVPFFLAVGDGAAANVGSGCVTPDRLALTIGTSAAARIMAAGTPAVVPVGLWNYRVDREHSMIGGGVSDGGGLFAWLLKTLRVGDPAGLDDADAALLARDPASHGLTVLPFLSGERSPGYASRTSLTITGMNASTDPMDILQAAVEAVTYELSHIAGLLRPFGAGDSGIVASGGAIGHSPYWLQLAADIFGKPVSGGDGEAASRGVAFLALKALGIIESLNDVTVTPESVFAPRAAFFQRHRQALERQEQLYACLVGDPAAANLRDSAGVTDTTGGFG